LYYAIRTAIGTAIRTVIRTVIGTAIRTVIRTAMCPVGEKRILRSLWTFNACDL